MFARFDEIPSLTLFKISRKLYIQKATKNYKGKTPLRITKENNSKSIGPSSQVFIINICHENRNVFARFDAILSMTKILINK